MSAVVLKDIVTSLHIHSAPHQNISEATFENLHTQSKQSIQRTLEILTGASNIAATESLNPNTSSGITDEAISGRTVDFQALGSYPNKDRIDEIQSTSGEYWYTFGSFGGRRNVCSAMDDPIVPLENDSNEEVKQRKRRILAVLKAARERQNALLKESGDTIPYVGDKVLNGLMVCNLSTCNKGPC